MTRSELFDVVYRFYPRGVRHIHRMYVPPGEPVYEDTDEYRRLVEAAGRGRGAYPTWKAMIDRLGKRNSLQNESLSLVSGGPDPAYSARIWLRGYKAPRVAFFPTLARRSSLFPKRKPPTAVALTFHVSLLGPYYGIHLPGIPEEEPVAPEIVREVEAAYPGYQPIPPELGNEVVPDVAEGASPYGEATIYTCIFSRVWTWADVQADDTSASTPRQ